MNNVVPFPKAEKLDLTELSFVHDYWVRPAGRKRGQPFRVFWAVSSSGNYSADLNAGRQMAVEWLRASAPGRTGNRGNLPVAYRRGGLARLSPFHFKAMQAGSNAKGYKHVGTRDYYRCSKRR
jgi:hypothetical protein